MVIAKVRLARGRVGFYDDASRLHLTITKPDDLVHDYMNTKGLRQAVSNGSIILVSGSFTLPDPTVLETVVVQPIVEQGNASEQVIEPEKVIESEKIIEPEQVVEPEKAIEPEQEASDIITPLQNEEKIEDVITEVTKDAEVIIEEKTEVTEETKIVEDVKTEEVIQPITPVVKPANRAGRKKGNK